MIDSVIVIGGNGFVGLNLIKKLNNQKINVIQFENSIKNKNSNLVIEWNKLTIEEISNKLKDYKIDIIINLAWSGTSGIDRQSFEKQMLNLEISKKAILLCKKMNIKQYINVGSIMEYEVFYDIKNNTFTKNKLYGLAKYNDHAISKIMCEEYGISYNSFKITNTFGPEEESQRLVVNIIKKCINNESMIFSKCNQLYNFIYIDDLVNLFYLLLFNAKSGETYILGSNQTKKLSFFIKKIYKNFKNIYPSFDNNNQTTCTKKDFNTNKSLKASSYKIQYSFDEAIKRTIEGIIKNGK